MSGFLGKRAAASLSRLVLPVVAFFALMAATGCVNDDDGDKWSIRVGESAPTFEVVLDNGASVSTADLAGRKTMLVFFNTDCEDCRRELPEIQRVADQLAADGSGALAGQTPQGDAVPRVICISRAEGAASVERYWALNGLTLPYSAQNDAAVYRLFAESLIPRVYIIGGDLKISAAYAETLPKAEELLRLMR